MSPDDPGVMGNLPRSRPGRRSSKRDGGAAKTETSSASPASTPKAGKTAAGRSTTRKAAPKRTTAKRTSASGTAASTRTRARAADRPKPAAERAQPAAERQEPAAQGSTDPITGAVLLAGKVVEGGLKVAGGIIKRLPRP